MNCPVFIESDIDNRREKWTEFIDILQEGDTAIIYSFSNTFVNYHDMIFFSEVLLYARHQNCIIG